MEIDPRTKNYIPKMWANSRLKEVKEWLERHRHTTSPLLVNMVPMYETELEYWTVVLDRLEKGLPLTHPDE